MGLLERQIALDYIYPKSGAPQGHLFLIFWGCKKLELLQKAQIRKILGY
jgi:hypothetical protein